MNNKFRKWQMFNKGLNNLLLLVLIFFSSSVSLSLHISCLEVALFYCSISCWEEKKKPALFVPCILSLIELLITRARIKWRTFTCHIASCFLFHFTSLHWDRACQTDLPACKMLIFNLTITAIPKEWRRARSQAEQGSSEEIPGNVGYIHKT